jgi:hypothetical protein
MGQVEHRDRISSRPVDDCPCPLPRAARRRHSGSCPKRNEKSNRGVPDRGRKRNAPARGAVGHATNCFGQFVEEKCGQRPAEIPSTQKKTGTGSAVVQWTTARVPCREAQADGIPATGPGPTGKAIWDAPGWAGAERACQGQAGASRIALGNSRKKVRATDTCSFTPILNSLVLKCG